MVLDLITKIIHLGRHMFNPNYSKNLQSSIEQAIGDLLQQSKTNTQLILERQAKINDFKSEIQTLADTTPSDQDNHESLEQARSSAIEHDCQTLATSIDSISEHISQKNTKNALDLIEPFIKNGKLLKARVSYIHELEELLQDFEQEKQVRIRLQKVASALELAMDNLPTSTTDTEVLEKNPENIINESTPKIETVELVNKIEQVTKPSTFADKALTETIDESEEKLLATISNKDLKMTLPENSLKSDINDLPQDQTIDFNKINSSPIATQSKHLDFMLQDDANAFVLDADALSGKALQDDLDALLLEANLLETEVDFSDLAKSTKTQPLSKSLFH
ncbi:MAG: hypothetical protein RLZZ422_2138 [Pseudomonadota bacterium]|jgi:hypothetical protein